MSGYPNLAFFGANGPVDPISSRVFGSTQWARSGLAWSGDGTTIIAAAGANPCGLMYISTDYGETFSILPIYNGVNSDPSPVSYTNVSVNSNASIILAASKPGSTSTSNQRVYRYFYGQSGHTNEWTIFSLGSGNGFAVPQSTGSYKTITSFLGDIQIICDSLSGSVFTSYDQGYSWYIVTYFQNSTGYQAAGVSSDGLTQIVLGSNTYLQTLIGTPQPTSSVLRYAAVNAGQTVYNAPAGVDGYTITPSLKNITGPSEYVWTTPTPGPSFYAQTITGTASICASPYASGYSNYGGVTAMFLVINITNPAFSQSQTFNISQVSTYPAITSSKYYSNSDSITYLIQNSGYTASNMSPGLYVLSVGAATGGNTCNSPAEVYIPPPPPTDVTIGGGSGGTQLSVTWTAPTNTYFQSSPTYDVYSNGSFLCNTASTNATMSNSGSATLVQVRTSNVGFTSTFASATSAPPDPPAGMTITGYSNVSNVYLAWTSNSPTTYYNISYGATTSNSVSSPFVVPLPPGSNVVIGLTALSNSLLSTKSILTSTNRIGSAAAYGITTNVNMTTNFIVTNMTIVGGGGAGGAGGWGGNAISTQGGGGGGQGGTLLFSNGTGPIQSPAVITIAAGKTGLAGTSGGGGGGGSGSTVAINGGTVAYAAGGGGGGGGNGGAGGGGTGYAGGGTGGTGGQAGTNLNGGGGGGGGSEGSIAVGNVPVGSYTSNNGSNGSSRAAAGGAVYSNYGGAGGGGAGAGAQQDISGATGNYATVAGCAGGGGAGGVAFSTNPSNSARGGPGADGYVTISYVYLTG
jgi:hypothetical protein